MRWSSAPPHHTPFPNPKVNVISNEVRYLLQNGEPVSYSRGESLLGRYSALELRDLLSFVTPR